MRVASVGEPSELIGQNAHTRPPERASIRGRRRIGPQVTRKYRAPVQWGPQRSRRVVEHNWAGLWESDVCVLDLHVALMILLRDLHERRPSQIQR